MVEDLNPVVLGAEALKHNPVVGTDDVVWRALPALPGVHPVLFTLTGGVAYTARHTVGAATLVRLVLTRVERFPSNTTRDHRVVLTPLSDQVEEQRVLTLVQVLLPTCLLGRLTTVVVLGTLAGVSFLVCGLRGADHVTTGQLLVGTGVID